MVTEVFSQCFDCQNIRELILSDVIDAGDLNVRRVSKGWKSYFDNVLDTLFKKLKNRVKEVPEALGLRSIVSQSLESPLNIIATVGELNRQLNRAMKYKPDTSNKFMITVEHIQATLAHRDLRLISEKVDKNQEFSSFSCEEINEYMKKNSLVFSNIKTLNLDVDIFSKPPIRLTSLPCEIGILAGLKELSLKNNDLRTLPKKIGALLKLKRLYLTSNSVQDLPEEFKALSKKLKLLYLSFNQLSSIPPWIGEFSQLKLLHLIGNQIQYLPKELALLSQLEELNLDDNPIFFIDKEILSSSNLVLSQNPRVLQFKEERRYLAKSQFSLLYQAIINRKKVDTITDEIQKAFFDLTTEDQNLIYKAMDPHPRADIFAKPDVFFLAAHRAGLKKFEALEPDVKKEVCKFISSLAGQPDTEFEVPWGEENALTNLPRLFDAIEKAQRKL